MNRAVYFLMHLFWISIISCTNKKGENYKDINPDAIYFDYQIRGEEEKDFITCMFQFRYGEDDETTLVLEPPSKVLLDGEVLNAESAKYSGAYYEVNIDKQEFEGEHTIIFTDINGKQYQESFNFYSFSLKEQFPETIKRDSFSIYLENVKRGTKIRYVLTDTSFESEGINEVQRINSSGRLHFTRAELDNLKSGPVTLLLNLERDRRLKNGTKEGGRLSISYALRREFELTD